MVTLSYQDLKKMSTTRRRRAFWELPYWQHQLLCHNFDVMHNFFKNIINTVIDAHGKAKDNAKSRMNVTEVCDRPELHLHLGPSGKPVKSKAKFILPVDK